MMRRRVIIYILCLALVLAVFIPVLTTPWLIRAGGFYARLGMSVNLACSMLCHQDPARSYHSGGLQMAVCHRCTGIYAGAIIGMLVCPFAPYFKRGTYPSMSMLLIFTLPVFIDIFLNITGIWHGLPVIRTITGAMVTFNASFYIVPAIDEMLTLIFKPRK